MCIIELRQVAPSVRAITQAFSLKCLHLFYLGLRAFSPLTLGFYIPGRWPDEKCFQKTSFVKECGQEPSGWRCLRWISGTGTDAQAITHEWQSHCKDVFWKHIPSGQRPGI